ncbi:uncharacterized protein MONOS_3106 [Monocercomonoides exilis]|uniref:uncharacterized protein n=1 Tax=Monocercomonoides exilis TaxID=2049356 RepID=UPI0035594A99|nr:hypothetical protein MONOS_3106 [Monocercomonoides exilis]|eukprot:MONOS_3106.1-p1 / transcript=MONOS_3106.1 / gene=MONOS_3106 / organism=Monocercomonoides_exilis_PA203 / gene_product=unspecified product / transcript_product=unspecified product / location=Mono_scaffold00070:41367-41762(-) / protein_length=103 / sequence_SO=supercontig / SO=protein_coding / is_pseudo=false
MVFQIRVQFHSDRHSSSNMSPFSLKFYLIYRKFFGCFELKKKCLESQLGIYHSVFVVRYTGFLLKYTQFIRKALAFGWFHIGRIWMGRKGNIIGAIESKQSE